MMLSKGIQFKKRFSAKQKELDTLEIDNPFCRAEIALQGGQVLHYQQKSAPEDQPFPSLLWLSELNSFEPAKAIRGGIPLCFPWFGTYATHANYPAHGFARNLVWTLTATDYDASLGHLIVLELSDQAYTRQFWDYAFKVEIHIRCGQQLSLEMHVFNTDQQPFEFTFAWHSYFTVSDISNAQILGLHDTAFIDQLADQQELQVENEPITIQQETDRIYPEATGHYQIHDQMSDIQIDTSSCTSAVVWNPWIEKTQRLGDVGQDAWQQFVCVECGVIGQPITLQAGAKAMFDLSLKVVRK